MPPASTLDAMASGAWMNAAVVTGGFLLWAHDARCFLFIEKDMNMAKAYIAAGMEKRR
jgi:hypothetical protein